MPFKSSCNLDNAVAVNGAFLLAHIGNCKSECKVVPFTLNAAVPKYARYFTTIVKQTPNCINDITFTRAS